MKNAASLEKMKSSHPVFSRYTDDPFKGNDIHRPSAEGHFAVHPKEHDPWSTQIWACRDALYDEHWDAMNMIKRALKFGFLGLAIGAGLAVTTRVIPSFAFRKAQHYVNQNTFGHAK